MEKEIHNRLKIKTQVDRKNAFKDKSTDFIVINF